jgi:hypothetical protein
VASFGELPRRDVAVRGNSLVALAPEAMLGHTELARGRPTPFTVDRDDLGIFGGQGTIGEFSLFERAGQPERSLLTSAGRGGERDFEAYRLGKGLLIRSGTPQWASRLAADSTVADATIRIWKLLGRG